MLTISIWHFKNPSSRKKEKPADWRVSLNVFYYSIFITYFFKNLSAEQQG
jgi:hypothetical protein